jgi:hypothetical protein
MMPLMNTRGVSVYENEPCSGCQPSEHCAACGAPSAVHMHADEKRGCWLSLCRACSALMDELHREAGRSPAPQTAGALSTSGDTCEYP